HSRPVLGGDAVVENLHQHHGHRHGGIRLGCHGSAGRQTGDDNQQQNAECAAIVTYGVIEKAHWGALMAVCSASPLTAISPSPLVAALSALMAVSPRALTLSSKTTATFWPTPTY